MGEHYVTDLWMLAIELIYVQLGVSVSAFFESKTMSILYGVTLHAEGGVSVF